MVALAAPFLYAAMGFITGAIAAVIYNLAAGWTGGLEMHFEGPPPAQAGFPQSPPQA